MRRLSDIGLSHLYYWAFFLILFAINQLGGQFLGSELMATRVVAVIFMIAVVLLAFFPGERKRTSTAPCRRSEGTASGFRLSAVCSVFAS